MNKMNQPSSDFVDHDFNESLDLFPVYCEHKSDTTPMRAAHAHRGFEFHITFSNRGMIRVEDREFSVYPGKVVIIPPLKYHRFHPAQKSVYNRAILSIEESYLQRLIEAEPEIAAVYESWFPGDDVITLEFSIASRELQHIHHITQQLESELKERRQGFELYVKTLLLQLILQLARTKDSCVVKERAAAEMLEIAERMTAYISERCCEGVDIPELTEKFHVSRSYVYKLVKQLTGYTPYQYIIMHRIIRAKEMLRSSNDSITQIALRAGFNDSPHFIRTFKEATGMTPGEFKHLPDSLI
ncbi:AraC family transcriptional regulator [Paenibacillus sp. GYB004]|uniref:AraC family transcriptional regulator n=1 Tax=Paenibacillus sp. GYB004 TaxID=2994393 RepID=UPI002F96C4D4